MANNTNGRVVLIPGPPRLPPFPLFPFMNAGMKYASICALAHCVSFSLKLWFCGQLFCIIIIAAHPVYSGFFHRAGPAVPAHTGSIFMLLTLSNLAISFFLVRLRVLKAVEVSCVLKKGGL